MSLVSSVPSTTIRPSWCVSSRLMQRIIVLLPEPDGPHTTTRSFWPTERVMSRRTCIAPYHLFTLSSRIAGCSLLIVGRSRVIGFAHVILPFNGACRGSIPAPAHGCSAPSRNRRRSRSRPAPRTPRCCTPATTGSAIASLPVVIRSKMPMMSTSDVSLKKPMNVLTSGGITSFNACGRMISSVFFAIVEARARPPPHTGPSAAPAARRAPLRPDTRPANRMMATCARSSLSDVQAGRHEQREHEARHEQQRHERHAADQLHIDRRTAPSPPAAAWTAAPARPARLSGNDRASPNVDRISVIGSPPQFSCDTNGMPANAAPHQHADQRQHARPRPAASQERQNARIGETRHTAR